MNKYKCGKCDRIVPAYYTLSHLTKGLWVNCPKHGKFARPYVPDLPLPYIPSKAYKKLLEGRTNQKSIV